MRVQNKRRPGGERELTVDPGLPTGLESARAQYYPHHRSRISVFGGFLMAISKRLRFEILRRDQHCCRYCGEHASPQVKLTIDHVLPTALGGTDDPTNLCAACGPCNAGKSASSPDAPIVAQVSDDAIRWAAAVRRSFDIALDELGQLRGYRFQLISHWTDGTDDLPHWRQPALPADWKQSVDTFCKRGMPIDLLIHAADKSLNNSRVAPRDKWTYFMGVAWKILGNVESYARDDFVEQVHE